MSDFKTYEGFVAQIREKGARLSNALETLSELTEGANAWDVKFLSYLVDVATIHAEEISASSAGDGVERANRTYDPT